jgi:hypothetical protein
VPKHNTRLAEVVRMPTFWARRESERERERDRKKERERE